LVLYTVDANDGSAHGSKNADCLREHSAEKKKLIIHREKLRMFVFFTCNYFGG